MKFFLDNCISVHYARALRVLTEFQKYEIVHLSEKFAKDTKDIVWIRELAKENDWVIISGDPRISRNKAEREAWHESGLTAFFFGDGWASRKYWKQAEDIVRWWPDIVLAAREAKKGTGFLLSLKATSMKEIYTQDQH